MAGHAKVITPVRGHLVEFLDLDKSKIKDFQNGPGILRPRPP